MKMGQLKALTSISLNEQQEFVMKSGWATIPASEAPNSDLAAGMCRSAAQTDAYLSHQNFFY